MTINPNEKILIIDTETTNSLDDPLCYDVGFIVVDLQGNIYEQRSFVVADVFLDDTLMESAYFADKIPQYWDDIKSGKRELRRYKTIQSIVRQLCREYGIRVASAHNARFDNKSLNTTLRFLTCSKFRFFLPYGVEWWDTLKMARKCFPCESYDTFCYENGYLTKRGCKRYTAEILYRYLTGDLEFEESHTGLEDVLIEKDIFLHCVQCDPSIDGRLWA